MDSSDSTGNCVTGRGMGTPSWMKIVTEKSTNVEFCGSPPSSDDFIHISRQRPNFGSNHVDGSPREIYKGNSGETCKKDRDVEVEPFMRSVSLNSTYSLPITNQSCDLNSGTSAMKLEDSSSTVKNYSESNGRGRMAKAAFNVGFGKNQELVRTTSATDDTETSKTEIVDITKNRLSERSSSALLSDGAITKAVKSKLLDELDTSQPITASTVSKAKKTGRDNSVASSCPVSPVSSPKIERKSGNPYFSGEMSSRNGSGNWLFRSSTPTEEMGSSSERTRPTSTGSSNQQSFKYVPRPSKLRELNFWSPTSM